MSMPPHRVGVRNLANALTLLRLLLVPVLALLLLAGGGAGWRLLAFAVFAAAVVTDRVDGEVARRRGLVTTVGKVADPIADKALIGTALVALSLLGELPWWVTGVVLAREAAVTAVRLVVLRYGVIAASRGGKAKTLVQALAVGLYLLPLQGLPAQGRAWVLAAAVVLTVLTGLDYGLRALRLHRAAGPARPSPAAPPGARG